MSGSDFETRPHVMDDSEQHPPLQPEQVEDFTNCLEGIRADIAEVIASSQPPELTKEPMAEKLEYLQTLEKYYVDMLNDNFGSEEVVTDGTAGEEMTVRNQLPGSSRVLLPRFDLR